MARPTPCLIFVIPDVQTLAGGWRGFSADQALGEGCPATALRAYRVKFYNRIGNREKRGDMLKWFSAKIHIKSRDNNLLSLIP